MAKKAQNILVLDLKGIVEIFDFFVILSATNERHLKILGDFIVEELKKEKIKPLSFEGTPKSGWLLIDYGNVIVNIFLEETRQFYQLERLFKDAKTTRIE